MDWRSKSALKRYCSKVGKHLVCKKSTKMKQISGLYNELADTISEPQTFSDLVARYGAPEEMAKLLQESVGEQESATVIKRNRQMRYLTFATAIMFSLFLAAAAFAALSRAYRILDAAPAYYIAEVHEGETFFDGFMLDK